MKKSKKKHSGKKTYNDLNKNEKWLFDSFVSQVAKDLPKKERDLFLKIAEITKNDPTALEPYPEFFEDPDDFENFDDKEPEENLSDYGTVDEVKKELEELEQYFSSTDFDTVYLDSEIDDVCNDEYSFALDEPEWEYKFWDNFGILEHLDRAFSVIRGCYEYGLFKEGWPLVKQIANIGIFVEGEAASEFDDCMHYWNFSEYGVFSYEKVNAFSHSLLPFIFFNCTPKDRVRTVFSLLCDSDFCIGFDWSSLNKFTNISAQERDDFFINLIRPLIEIMNNFDLGPEIVVRDLICNISSQDLLIEEAKQYLNTYPKFMISYVLSSFNKAMNNTEAPVAAALANKAVTALSLLSLIQETVEEIPSKFDEKLYLLEIGIRLAKFVKKQDIVEDLSLLKFSLKPSPKNYLKLRYLSDDYHKYDEQIREIYEKAYTKEFTNKQKRITIDQDIEPSYFNEFSMYDYYLMKMLDGRYEEAFFKVRKGVDVKSYPDSLFYKGLLLGYLLLVNGKCKDITFDFIKSNVGAFFTLFDDLDFMDDGDLDYFMDDGDELEQLSESFPPADVLMKLWLDHTSIQNGYEEKLFEIVDENLYRLITEMLASKRTCFDEDVINLVVMLLNIYDAKGCHEKKERLLTYIATEHLGKRAFIKRLYDVTGIKLDSYSLDLFVFKK